MTLALAWGLVSGTIITLIWVPCGYAIIEDYMALVWRIINKITGKQLGVEAMATASAAGDINKEEVIYENASKFDDQPTRDQWL